MRDPVFRLLAHPGWGPSSELNERARRVFIDGAAEEWSRARGRPPTEEWRCEGFFWTSRATRSGRRGPRATRPSGVSASLQRVATGSVRSLADLPRRSCGRARCRARAVSRVHPDDRNRSGEEGDDPHSAHNGGDNEGNLVAGERRESEPTHDAC